MPEVIPLLQQLVEKRLQGTDQISEGNVLDAALDALIQLEAKVPCQLIDAIYQKRTAQALILLSKIGRDGDSLLLNLAVRERGMKWFTAANLLLANRTDGFAFLLLKDLSIVARITVSEDGSKSGGIGGGGSGGVGDGIGVNSPDYPPHAYYYLTSSRLPQAVLLSPGPKNIYYRRMVSSESQYGVPTNEDGGPDSGDRLQYVNALGDFQKKMPISAAEYKSIAWRGLKALEAEKEKFREDILHRYKRLVQMLREEHLLTKEEASIVPNPTIDVRFMDLRSTI